MRAEAGGGQMPDCRLQTRQKCTRPEERRDPGDRRNVEEKDSRRQKKVQGTRPCRSWPGEWEREAVIETEKRIYVYADQPGLGIAVDGKRGRERCCVLFH